MEDELLEPLKAYNSFYKESHYNNVVTYFDDLVTKSNIDIESNRATCKEYYNKLKKINNLNKDLNKKNIIRMFLIILSIICGFSILICGFRIYKFRDDLYINLIIICISIILLITFILIIVKVINKKIKTLLDKKAILEKETNELCNLAWSQMAPLNALYDWSIPSMLFSKTIPKIVMDKNFDSNKYLYLHEKYNFGENISPNKSTVFMQSGSILGNPFIMKKDYIQSWFNKVYTGSITIHWTTTSRDSNGNMVTKHHTQTLVASITKPAPKYEYETTLVYGCDAAPNLSFYRYPSNVDLRYEKDIAKYVKKGVKDLNKKAQLAIKKGDDYTRLDNDEFEVLFGDQNRNNEVEFRLLYTPLAQKNFLDLIKSNSSFRDDFYQGKDGCLNMIKSRHSQKFDYDSNPIKFIGFDYDKVRENFIKYNNDYFKNFYFDLAPLLSIPLYQTHMSSDYIYETNYVSNITQYEHEIMANSFNINNLKHPSSKTPSILKTEFLNKEDVLDNVKVTAKGFDILKRVTFVPKFGGDGRMHHVPVYWLEYVPVSKETIMAVENKESSRYEFNNIKENVNFNNTINSNTLGVCSYQRGLFATLSAICLTKDVVNKINSNFINDNVSTDKVENIMIKVLKEKENIDNILNSNNFDCSEKILKDDNIEALEVSYDENNV